MASRLQHRTLATRSYLAVAALSLSLVIPALLGAQDAPASPRAKPRGRLPAYYAKVVTPQQKEQVYGVQAQFESKIDALEAQIVELERKRDDAVRALLTPEQRKQIDELAAAAESRRQERKAKEAAEEQAANESAPAAKAGARATAKPK